MDFAEEPDWATILRQDVGLISFAARHLQNDPMRGSRINRQRRLRVTYKDHVNGQPLVTGTACTAWISHRRR
jgi:hypothetical protein